VSVQSGTGLSGSGAVSVSNFSLVTGVSGSVSLQVVLMAVSSSDEIALDSGNSSSSDGGAVRMDGGSRAFISSGNSAGTLPGAMLVSESSGGGSTRAMPSFKISSFDLLPAPAVLLDAFAVPAVV
jgi:hypothetical protein